MKASKHSGKINLKSECLTTHARMHSHPHTHQCYISTCISDRLKVILKEATDCIQFRLKVPLLHSHDVRKPSECCFHPETLVFPFRVKHSLFPTDGYPFFFLPPFCHFKQRPGRFHPSNCFPVKCLLGNPDWDQGFSNR